MEEQSTPAASWSLSRAPSAGDSRFSCNICLDPVAEPVVTQCGHLYCWPCLYRWLEPGMLEEERISLGIVVGSIARRDESRRCCPVCKSGCSVSTLVPIYVRSEPNTSAAVNQSATRNRSNSSSSNIGSRQTSSVAQQNDQRNENATDSPAGFSSVEAETTVNVATPSNETVGAPPEVNDFEALSIDEHSASQSTTGLRRRLRFRPSGEREDPVPNNIQETSEVPSRPAPIPSPTRREASGTTNNNRPSLVIVRSPPQQRASLSHGLAMAIQHVFFGGQEFSPEHVPPLHRRQGQNGEAGGRGMAGDGTLEQQNHTTEFLSRLLIMLASFVILCLLLF